MDIHAIPLGALTTKRYRFTAPSSITSKSGAQRWGEQVRREIEQGKPPPKGREQEVTPKASPERQLTFAEAVPIYLEDSAGRGNAPGTVSIKRSVLESLSALLGDEALETVSEASASRVRATLRARGLSTSTINLHVGTLSTMLRRLHAMGQRKAPPPTLERVKERRIAAPKAYDAGTFEHLVIAAQRLSVEHLAIVLIGGEAGLRAGEMRGLEVRDIDFEKNTILVERALDDQDNLGPPKNNETRRVPMTGRLASTLRVLTEHRRSTEPLLTGAEGERLTRSQLRHALYAAQRAAGLPKKGPHVLRHTAATTALEGGADPVAVQKLLGHRQLATTIAVYLHDTGDAPQRAVAALAQARAKAAPGVTDLSRVPRSAGKPRKCGRKDEELP